MRRYFVVYDSLSNTSLLVHQDDDDEAIMLYRDPNILAFSSATTAVDIAEALNAAQINKEN